MMDKKREILIISSLIASVIAIILLILFIMVN